MDCFCHLRSDDMLEISRSKLRERIHRLHHFIVSVWPRPLINHDQHLTQKLSLSDAWRNVGQQKYLANFLESKLCDEGCYALILMTGNKIPVNVPYGESTRLTPQSKNYLREKIGTEIQARSSDFSSLLCWKCLPEIVGQGCERARCRPSLAAMKPAHYGILLGYI